MVRGRVAAGEVVRVARTDALTDANEMPTIAQITNITTTRGTRCDIVTLASYALLHARHITCIPVVTCHNSNMIAIHL